ncbi:hypothetical protein [Longimicrobium sp.]|uniref:hypothetical protein n=1 Tax=Longimicrobium sp. TaxID=2029185 RepID=UPI002E334ED7|nr:hypothetical protein [Longimicrobium sp.]HEX6041176.1 hypothetical protein [Longimicrobium sp.]
MTGSHRLEAITLIEGALEVELWRDPTYTPGSADNVHRYGREIIVGGHRGKATGVEARVDGRAVASAVLLCETGCPGVMDGDALLRDGTLFVSLSDFVVALRVPSLEARWMTDVDGACPFGLMEISGADALLVHGELWITRLGLDGRVQWRQGGADIFTGGCWIVGDEVVAADWNGAEYRWRLSDGELLGVVPDAHPPTWANAHNPGDAQA